MNSQASGALIQALKNRLAAVHVNHRQIAAGAALIGVLTIVAKLFATVREMAIAWRFGTSGTVDAYQLALTITTWLPTMLSSVMTVVLVPRLVALQDREKAYRSFLAELNGTIVILGGAVTLLIFIAAPAASALLASSVNVETLHLTAAMSRLMAPVAFFAIAVGYLSARLQSRERFGYSVTEAVPALAIALFAIAPFAAAAASRLVWGTLLGFFFQAAILCAMTQRSNGGIGSFRVRHRSSEWNSVYGSILVMSAAQLTLALTIPVDQAFAARLGPGAVATLGYANRIVILATGFGAVVLARALLPVLARAAVAGDFELGARQARQWAWLLLFAGASIALAIAFLSNWGVALVFERGAFTSRDSARVAELLRVGVYQIPFYFAGLAAVQWIAALGRYFALFIIACVALGSKLLLNMILVPKLGLEGIMIATAGMYALSFGCQFFVAGRQ